MCHVPCVVGHHDDDGCRFTYGRDPVMTDDGHDSVRGMRSLKYSVRVYVYFPSYVAFGYKLGREEVGIKTEVESERETGKRTKKQIGCPSSIIYLYFTSPPPPSPPPPSLSVSASFGNNKIPFRGGELLFFFSPPRFRG